jgi:hypothetical protein
MSQRLPTPGSDVGTWGFVLNGYLQVAHDSAGNLLPAALTAGGAVLATNNLSDLQSAAVSRTNLGLGSAAIQNASAFLQPANNLSDVSSAATARANLSAAQWFSPTSVQTTAYTANPGDFVPVDASGSSVTITLPTTPADKTRIGVKLVNVSGVNTATIASGGADVFNKVGGSTSLSLSLLNQGLLLQYASGTGIWYVQVDDIGLTQLDARYSSGVSVVHLAGAETITGVKTFSAAPVIPTITNTGTLTLPTSTDTLVGRATTDTLTNKRVTKRVVALTDGTTIATNADSGDVFTVTIAASRTISNPTGTPTDGQQIMYRITQGTGGSFTITWGSIFHFSTDVPTPTLTTAAAKTDYIGFQYNAANTSWDCLAVARGY